MRRFSRRASTTSCGSRPNALPSGVPGTKDVSWGAKLVALPLSRSLSARSRLHLRCAGAVRSLARTCASARQVKPEDAPPGCPAEDRCGSEAQRDQVLPSLWIANPHNAYLYHDLRTHLKTTSDALWVTVYRLRGLIFDSFFIRENNPIVWVFVGIKIWDKI